MQGTIVEALANRLIFEDLFKVSEELNVSYPMGR